MKEKGWRSTSFHCARGGGGRSYDYRGRASHASEGGSEERLRGRREAWIHEINRENPLSTERWAGSKSLDARAARRRWRSTSLHGGGDELGGRAVEIAGRLDAGAGETALRPSRRHAKP